MKKRIIALIIALALLIPCVFAENALPRARKLYLSESFEDMEGFSYNKETYDWSIVSDETAEVLRAIEGGALSGNGIFFYLEIRGNDKTDTLLPVLNFLRIGYTPENANAVSLFIDDTRYDIAVTCESYQSGSIRGEKMCALLKDSDLSLIDTLRGVKELDIYLHGATGITYEIEVKDKTSKTAKERVEEAAFGCLSFVDTLRSMDFSSYMFSTEDAEAWEDSTGVEPRIEITNLAEDKPLEGKTIPELDEDTHLLTVDDSGTEVTLLQKKLIEIGYQFVAASSTYNKNTRTAVLNLQKKYGLLPTGSVDSALLAILFGENTEGAPVDEENALPEIKALGDVSVSLDRYWFAQQVNTEKSESVMSSITCDNTDDLLLVADGVIMNNTASQISLGYDVTAQFLLNGEYAFDAELAIERDNGTRFDSTLGALAIADFVVTAELPAYLESSEDTWTLVIRCGENELTYQLQ